MLLGKSTALMVELLAAVEERPRFCAYDRFDALPLPEAHDPEMRGYLEAAARRPHGRYQAVREMLGDGLALVDVFPMDSLTAAATHPLGSASFVFLDDNHETDHVRAELAAWWPVVRQGGVLAGHDYDWPSVRAAVDPWAAALGVDVAAVGRAWVVRKA